jgi:hypothetical protein
MSMDFAALTAAVGAGVSEVRACLLVSRDGLALGSYPPAEESSALEKWIRLASLGPVERGFAVVGEECWVFCSRGPYSALAVAKASVRPGVILERLDQMVLTAEEGRLRKEGITAPGAGDLDAAARRRRPTAPPTRVHPQASPPRSSDGMVDVRPGEAGTVQPTRGFAPGSSSPGGLEAGRRPTGEPSTRSGPTDPSPPIGPAGPDGGWAEQQRATPPESPRSDPGNKDSPPGQRTVWVMDADDLTKEFAALLDDPDDPGRDG